jgi:hypothetical protein
LDRVGDELFVALTSGAATVDDGDERAILVEGVGIDSGERTDAAARRPGARRFAVRDRDALAAFYQRQDLTAGNGDLIQRLHSCVPRLPTTCSDGAAAIPAAAVSIRAI